MPYSKQTWRCTLIPLNALTVVSLYIDQPMEDNHLYGDSRSCRILSECLLEDSQTSSVLWPYCVFADYRTSSGEASSEAGPSFPVL
jgi:hypothetical protein